MNVDKSQATRFFHNEYETRIAKYKRKNIRVPMGIEKKCAKEADDALYAKYGVRIDDLI